MPILSYYSLLTFPSLWFLLATLVGPEGDSPMPARYNTLIVLALGMAAMRPGQVASSQSGTGLSLLGYLLGIAVAVVVFLVREKILQILSGFRFRKWFAKDTKRLVENHLEHLTSLREQQAKLEPAIALLREKKEPELELSPIWSCEFSTLERLFQNSYHLKTDVFELAVSFYDTSGRISEVRKSYNYMLQRLILKGNRDVGVLQFLNSSLKFMLEDYGSLISCGCELLLLLAEKHWFLNVDTARCREMKGKC